MLSDHAKVRHRITQVLFLLTIFFLPTQLGKHFWPSFSFVLGSRVDYLSPTLFFTDILVHCLITLVFLETWTLPRMRAYIKHIHWGVVGFFLLILLSALLSTRPLLGLYGVIRLVVYFLFGYGVYKLLTKENIRRQARVVFALALVLQSLLALLQYANQGSLGGLLYWIGERTFSSGTPGIANASINGQLIMRPYGTLPHPNVLAAYLLTGIVFLFPELLKRNKVRKLFFIATMSMSAIALLFTMSRSVLLVAGCFVFGVLLKPLVQKRNTVGLALTALLSVVVLFLIGLFTPLAGRLTTSIVDESLTQRIQLLDYSVSMFADNPLVGVGPLHFLVMLPLYQSITSGGFLLQPVHNIFFLLLSEIGIGGFVGVCVFLFGISKRIQQNIGVLRFQQMLLFTLFLLLGMTDHYFLTVHQGLLLTALILGYCCVVPPYSEREI